jgi:hypothetical protein
VGYAEDRAAALTIVRKDASWWRSPTRIFRRAAIGILGSLFFVNGLAKGGLRILVLAVILGWNWVDRHTWASISIAFLVGGIAISIPCAYLMSKEDDARKAKFNKAYSAVLRAKKQHTDFP